MAKKKKPKVERTKRTSVTPSRDEWAEKFFAALASAGTISDACKIANVSRTNVYQRRDRDPAFAAELSAALEAGTDVLEREAIRRAAFGVDEPVIYQGELMGCWVAPDGSPAKAGDEGARFVPLTVKKYSDALLAMLLKAKRYGDHVSHTHSGGETPVRVQYVDVEVIDVGRLGDRSGGPGETPPPSGPEEGP